MTRANKNEQGQHKQGHCNNEHGPGQHKQVKAKLNGAIAKTNMPRVTTTSHSQNKHGAKTNVTRANIYEPEPRKTMARPT